MVAVAALPIASVALEHARRGLHVFPCNPTNKRPLVEDWPGKATTDPDVIAGWWRQWPNAMIGFVTGARSGCWVLDVDNDDEKGLDGEASLEELCAAKGSLPPTALAQTPRGGRHFFFKHPGRKVVNRAGRDGAEMGKGLDVRGDGGYVILAGSLTATGRRYAWVRDPAEYGFADAPAWLLDMVCERAPAPLPANTSLPVVRDLKTRHDALAYVAAAINDECRQVARSGKGGRNHQLNIAAFAMGQFVGAKLVDRGLVEASLHDAAACCGLIADDGDRAVRATIKSGIDAGMQQPREIPERARETGQNGQNGQTAGQIRPAPQVPEGHAVPDYGSGDEPEGKKRRLKLVLFDQIAPRLNSAKLVKGWLTEGAMSVVYGESNCGKTFVALDLGLHIALGWEWRGKKVKQGVVVYVAAEGGFGISNRVEAFKRHHELTDTEVPFAMVPCGVDLCDPEADTAELIEVVKEAAATYGAQALLVVIDTLARAMAGGNENAPDDMGSYVRNVDRIREETGAHVMSIHHSGKDAAKGARGHSSLRAATDTEIEITRDDGSKIGWIRATKQKELPTDAEEAFELKVVELGSDEDGESVTSCVLAETEGARERRGADRTYRLPNSTKVALDLLKRAIVDEGKIPPGSNNIPNNVRAVQASVWKEYCYAGLISDSDRPEAKQKAFKRAFDGLLASKVIGSWGGWIWVI